MCLTVTQTLVIAWPMLFPHLQHDTFQKHCARKKHCFELGDYCSYSSQGFATELWFHLQCSCFKNLHQYSDGNFRYRFICCQNLMKGFQKQCYISNFQKDQAKARMGQGTKFLLYMASAQHTEPKIRWAKSHDSNHRIASESYRRDSHH